MELLSEREAAMSNAATAESPRLEIEVRNVKTLLHTDKHCSIWKQGEKKCLIKRFCHFANWKQQLTSHQNNNTNNDDDGALHHLPQRTQALAQTNQCGSRAAYARAASPIPSFPVTIHVWLGASTLPASLGPYLLLRNLTVTARSLPDLPELPLSLLVSSTALENRIKRAETESRRLGNDSAAVSTELAAVLIVAFGLGPTSCRAADAVEGHRESWRAHPRLLFFLHE